MSETSPVLLLTRPETSSQAFLERLRGVLGREVDAAISPVIEIVDHGPIPDLTPFQTLILTSKHAARRLGHAQLLKDRTVATVGEGTGRVAETFGAHVSVLGENVDAFLQNAQSLSMPCLHCRGVHTRGALATTLSDAGIETHEAVIYDQQSRDLSDGALALLKGPRPVVAPVFSPRSSALLARQVPHESNLRVIAISAAAADAWEGSVSLTVSTEPTAAAMAAAVAASL